MIAEMTQFFASLEPITNKVIGALLIIFIGFIVGRLSGLMIRRVLHSVNLDKNLRRVLGGRISLEKFLSQIISLLLYATAIIMSLNYLGLTTIVLTIITSAIIVVFTLSFLLAIRDLLPNLFAGIALKYRGDISVGDKVSVRNVDGRVEEISVLNTRIRAGDDLIILPNSLFQKEGFSVKHKPKS